MARGTDRSAAALNDPDAVDAALRAAVAQIDEVLAEQERAATRILGLAELLMERAPDAATRLRIEAVMESCAFQDTTGQRLRRVRGLLSRLSARSADGLRLNARPVPRPESPPPPDNTISAGDRGLTQEQVDRLLGKR
jgi:hypothetical protein